MPNLHDGLRLYVATDRALAGERDLPAIVAAALRGGATAVQLRDKHSPARHTLALGQALRTITRAADALFIVNDRADLALALEADGVHLGQDDLPVTAARRILGPRAIIGVSTNTPEEARRAEQEGADYLGVGPAYPTSTRANPRTLLGPPGIARVRQATRLPMVAIGGIIAARVPALRRSAVDGVCVIAAIIAAPDPEQAARDLRAVWEDDNRITGVRMTTVSR